MSLEARLIQQTGAAPGREIPLSAAVVLGRSEEADFVVDDDRASRRHVELRPEADAWVVIDLASSNGTFLNQAKIPPNAPVRLQSGVRLRLGDTEFLFAGGQTAPNPPTQSVPMKATLTIGRAEDCDLVIPSPNVSRYHSKITQTPQGWILEDLTSQNGTYLNGVRVLLPEPLRQGDEVSVDLHRFVFRSGVLEHFDQSKTVRIDVDKLEYSINHEGSILSLLEAVSFVIQPKEFVAIVGGSGAGKSTLLHVMAGIQPATDGAVLLNQVNLYDNLELFRAVIGYVPQEDVVHRELRVESALRYTAELRLPPDMESYEREELIDDILRELELSHRKTALVSTLSGGERKRVSVAMELLCQPGLLFLDEPTSGLDPGLELKFLQLVKRLAREGRTIVMVTHSTSNIAECDKLLFLARGGRVAFYGPPQDALEFFGVTDMAQCYLRVSDDPSQPRYWEEKFRQSEYYRRYVADPLAGGPQHRKGQTQMVAKSLGAKKPRPKAAGQFQVLLRRYVDTLCGDVQNLGLLLAQAPIIALILLAVFPSNLFATGAAQLSLAAAGPKRSSLLFFMVLSALLFGVINAVREITKESAIYRRERLVNLKPGPYLLSKIVVLSALCVIQSVLLVGILRLKIDFHLSAGDYLVLTGVLVLMTLCGSLLGLLISCVAVATTKANDRANLVAKANDRAMSLVPIIVLPQVVFSGMFELDSLSTVGKAIPIYWAYGALGSLLQLNTTIYKLVGHTREQFTITPGGAALALTVIGAIYALFAFTFLAWRR